MDAILWWTGAATWVVMALLGVSIVAEWIIDRIARAFGLSSAFLQWVWQREKSRRAQQEG